MMSKSWSFKLLRDEVRRNLWGFALSLLGFFAATPLYFLMMYQTKYARWGSMGVDTAAEAERLREMCHQEMQSIPAEVCGNLFATVGMMIMGLLCGAVLFRYLHDRRQVDFYHSLPIRRGQLLALKFTAGAALVLPAWLVMQIAGLVLSACFGLAGGILWKHFLLSMLRDLLAFFAVYSMTILCMVLSGNTIAGLVLDAWAMFSPTILALVYGGFARSFYPTYWMSIDGLASLLCPWLALPVMVQLWNQGKWLPVVFWPLATVGMLALSVWLFCRRRSESAGAPIAFRPVQVPLKIYFCLAIAVFCGWMFGDNVGEVWMWFGAAAGAVLTHALAEIIYHTDFRAALKHLPTMAVVTAASLALVFGLKADVFGYSTWVPSEGSLRGVNLADCTLYAGDSLAHMSGNWNSQTKLADPELVAAVHRLAELGVENIDLRQPKGNRMIGSTSEAAAVTMARIPSAATKNQVRNPLTVLGVQPYYEFGVTFYRSAGREATRKYTVPWSEESAELIEKVLYSEENLRQCSAAFNLGRYKAENPEKTGVTEISVFDPRRGLRDSIYTVTDTEADALLEALQADILDTTAEKAQTEPLLFSVDISLRNRNEHNKAVSMYSEVINVYPYYTRTLALLKGHTPAPLSADEISRIEINDWRERTNSDPESSETTRTVDDPAEIAALLDTLALDDYYGNGTVFRLTNCQVYVYLKDGGSISYSFLANKIPEDYLTTLYGAPLA